MNGDPSSPSLESVDKDNGGSRIHVSHAQAKRLLTKRIPVQYRTRISALYSAARKGGRLRSAHSVRRLRMVPFRKENTE